MTANRSHMFCGHCNMFVFALCVHGSTVTLRAPRRSSSATAQRFPSWTTQRLGDHLSGFEKVEAALFFLSVHLSPQPKVERGCQESVMLLRSSGFASWNFARETRREFVATRTRL